MLSELVVSQRHCHPAWDEKCLSGIKNKPQSTLRMMSAGSVSAASHHAGGMTGSSAADWSEMEAKLQYMEAQVEEAQSALGRKVTSNHPKT